MASPSPTTLFAGLALLWAMGLGPLAVATEAQVSFRNDVMAVLAKGGCNAGTCHGNKNGKGGFKLSLRGQDPEQDYLSLTRDFFGRRINPLAPEESLLLLKPTTAVPHEGGQRFSKGSEGYEILHQWMKQGLRNDLKQAPRLERIRVTPAAQVLIEPEKELQLRVVAEFADGATRDVTGLAVYEPANSVAKISAVGLVNGQAAGESTVLVRYLHCQEPVRVAFVPARPGFRWEQPPVHNYIDSAIFAKLRTLRMQPAGLATDEVFLRRAYLDLLGILPTAREARSFAALTKTGGNDEQARSARRTRLIDELLERPEFADFWALKWADLLRVEAHSLDQKGVQNFHHWIRQSMAQNKPLDQFVRELLTARGSTYANPAANYFRPQRDPLTRARAAAQVFLGTRLQCAECHNHPSDRWTQDDYYDWARIFSGVSYKVLENNREISSDEHEWKGEQVVYVSRGKRLRNPRTGGEARARFLGSSGVEQQDGDELAALAQWLTNPENPWFARVQANRIWYHLMGRGLVDPPDDFRATNPPSHPELLEALARDLVAQRFDARHLIRLIMSSRTYQLDAEENETNSGDEANYSHRLRRRMEAEQLLDCQSQAAGVPLQFAHYPVGLRAAQLPGVRPESKGRRRADALDQFLEIFGKPPRLLTTDNERSCECNMGQAFQMISGPAVNELLAAKENRISRLLEAGKSDAEILEELFWTTLSRGPRIEESSTLAAQVRAGQDRRREWEDVLWALLNSKEFILRP